MPLPVALLIATKFPRLWKYRRVIGYGLAALAAVWAIWAAIDSYGDRRAKEAADAVQVKWDADKQAWNDANAKVKAENMARENAALARNQEIERLTDEKLAAIDRADGLGRMLREASDRLRRVSAAQATDQLGVAVATGIATRASEAAEALERQWDAYDRSCQRDAVRFDALQRQVAGQL